MKHILLIDDEYKQLKTIFIRIAEMIFLHHYEIQDNKAKDSYKITWIRILYDKDYVSAGRVELEVSQEIKKLRENLLAELDISILPSIKFQSVPVKIDATAYPLEIDQIAEKVQESIKSILKKDVKFALLLDVILNDKKDIVLLMERGVSILSEKLWSANNEHAIPYSNFGSSSNEPAFREKWKERTQTPILFDKNELVDEDYNREFMENLYVRLGLTN